MGSGFGLPIGLTISLVASKVAAGGASDTGRGPALLLSISSPITCPRFNFLRPLCSRDEAQSEEWTRQGAQPLPPLLQLAMMGIAARPWLPASVPAPPPCQVLSPQHSLHPSPGLLCSCFSHLDASREPQLGTVSQTEVPAAQWERGAQTVAREVGSQGKGDQGVGSAGSPRARQS